MQRAMYVLAQGLAAEPDPPTTYDDDPPGTWRATNSPWIGRRVTRHASTSSSQDGNSSDLGVVSSDIRSRVGCAYESARMFAIAAAATRISHSFLWVAPNPFIRYVDAIVSTRW